jgi:hypothetical protein
MNKYIGTKTVNATPMNRLDYNILRGWQLPADENGADEGYLVEYTDGGKANHPQFAGYISWSPKDMFERSYHLAEAKVPTVLQPHQVRVVEELDQLRDRLNKINAFIATGYQFLNLDTAEQSLLREQAAYMTCYVNVLERRVDSFK